VEFQNVTSFFHDFCAIQVKSDESRRISRIEIFFGNIGHDAVFDWLSESEIRISDDSTWDQIMVKIRNEKKWQK
jgi:hypothetical protein